MQRLNADAEHQRMSALWTNRKRAAKRREAPSHRVWALRLAIEKQCKVIEYEHEMDEIFYTALVEVWDNPALISTYYPSSTEKTRALAERKVAQCRQKKIPLLLIFDNATTTECMVAISLWKMKIKKGPMFMLWNSHILKEEYYASYD